MLHCYTLLTTRGAHYCYCSGDRRSFHWPRAHDAQRLQFRISGHVWQWSLHQVDPTAEGSTSMLLAHQHAVSLKRVTRTGLGAVYLLTVGCVLHVV